MIEKKSPTESASAIIRPTLQVKVGTVILRPFVNDDFNMDRMA